MIKNQQYYPQKKLQYHKPPLRMGAWKLAYADFVTAMMCFFMLMWLLNAVPSEKLKDVAMYFKPTFGFMNRSEESGDDTSRKTRKDTNDTIYNDSVVPSATNDLDINTNQEFMSLQSQITDEIQKDITLKNYSANISFHRTNEGLEISILDNNNGEMFQRGSAELTESGKEMLIAVSHAIKYIPNLVAIGGYTEKSNNVSISGYSKWDLSSARANAARKILQMSGIPQEKIAKISAYGDNMLLVRDDPYSPRNRRVSVTLLTKFDNVQYRIPNIKTEK